MTTPISNEASQGKPHLYIEADWFPFDRFDNANQPEYPFNSSYDDPFPIAFEGYLGISTDPSRLWRGNAGLGFGYFFRTNKPINPDGDPGYPSYLHDLRTSLDFELSLRVPPRRKAGFFFGGGVSSSMNFLTSRPYDPEYACMEYGSGGCEEWLERGGIPLEDGTRIELDKALGLGGSVYGILGGTFGPVSVLFKSGPQFLYIPSVDWKDTGVFAGMGVRVALPVRLATTEENSLVSSEIDSDAAKQPEPQVSPVVSSEQKEVEKPYWESFPTRMVGDVEIPAIQWEKLGEEHWQAFKTLFRFSRKEYLPYHISSYPSRESRFIMEQIAFLYNACQQSRGEGSQDQCLADLESQRRTVLEGARRTPPHP